MKMKRTMVPLALAALVGLVTTTPAGAADYAKGSEMSLSDLAASYNVSQTDLTNLRDKGWSWNEIGNALAISKRSGRPLQEVVAERDSGMGWHQIADKYGFKFGEVSKEAKRVSKDGRRAEKASKHGEAVRQGTGSTNQENQNPAANPTNEGDMGPGNQGPAGTSNPGNQNNTMPANPGRTNP